MLDEQTGVADGHAIPQPPQEAAFARLVSHPESALQSAKPGAHIEPHVPFMHVGTELTGAGQAAAQLPQWSGVDSRSISQPSAGFMLQSAKPASQWTIVH